MRSLIAGARKRCGAGIGIQRVEQDESVVPIQQTASASESLETGRQSRRIRFGIVGRIPAVGVSR
jgi:hypothetical protein